MGSHFWAMKVVIVLLLIAVYPILAQEEILKQKLHEFRDTFLPNYIRTSQNQIKFKRSACDDGKGNFGINSFNFLAFILLTFNVVANVNNNLNNNNNNKNDQNINAISQNSNNVATNTNSGNVIGVTVLPIPGKRSLNFWKSLTLPNTPKSCPASDKVASLLFHRLVQLKEFLNGRENRCQSHDICQTILQILDDLHLDDAVVMGLMQSDRIPFLSISGCRSLFLGCAM